MQSTWPLLRWQMDRMEHASDPLDVFFQIQTRLAQLDLNRPVANAVEVADANSFAFQILQRLDMRRADPDVGVLVALAA